MLTFSERLCDLEQTEPCVVNSDLALNQDDGTCQVWPPLYPRFETYAEK